MADTQFGTLRLRLENRAHNDFADSCYRPISEQRDLIFISNLIRDDETLTTCPTTYLVVCVDLDQNGEVGAHEFERLELDFSR